MNVINRIKKSDDFLLTIKKGKTYRNEVYTVHIANNNLSYIRVGLSVSNKIGNAVTRNLIKRQVRSIVDECLDYQKVSKDMIIVISKEYSVDMFQDNRTKLMKLIGSIQEN